jgi:uncharacterized repeat protein (TIGR02543 family)
MKKFTQVKFVAAFLAAIAMIIGFAAPANASTPEIDAGGVSYLNFSNNVKIGQFAKPGFTTRYAAVMPGVDAILTVTTPISNTTINNVDRVSTKDNWQLWSNLGIGSGGGSAGYRIDFVAANTNNPVILKDLKINVGDIDAKQYVEFAGVQSYLLSPPGQTKLTATGNNAGAWKFSEDNGVGDPTDADPNFLVQVNYAAVSSVGITMGAPVGGSALFQVAFSAGNWASVTPQVVQPTPLPFRIIYNGNGGTGSVQTTTANTGVAQTISSNSGGFTLSGAAFIAWNTRSDGSGVKYDAGDTIIPTADTTLYAMWQTPPKLVTYFGNTSTGGIPPESVTINGNYTLASPGSLVKDGYSFIGWNTDPGGTGIPYESGEKIIVDVNRDLYAQWQLIPTPPGGIEINTNPGSTTNGAEVPYNIPDLKPGELFAVEVIPSGNPTAAEEIDAGYADSSGNAIGSTTLPGGLGQGDYTVYFSGIDADGDPMQVVLPFSVGPNGSLDSQGTPTRSKVELANTGIPDAALPWLMSMAFIALILGAAGVVAAREIRKLRK